MFDIDRLTYYIFNILKSEPFLAAFAQRLKKVSSNAVSTAGMALDEEQSQYVLLYNPMYFESLTDLQIEAVLRHEFYHALLGHLTQRAPNGTISRNWNCATDLAINSWILNLPEKALIAGKAPYENLPPRQAAEWYFKKLQQQQQQQQQSAGQQDGQQQQSAGQQQPDGSHAEGVGTHSQWCGSDGAQEIAAKKLHDAAMDSLDAVCREGWGSIPRELRKEIQRQLSQPVVDWRSLFRFLVQKSQRAERRGTWRKISRRKPYVRPGRRTSRTANVAICFDQSASVTCREALVSMFFAQCEALLNVADFTLVPFDCTVATEAIQRLKKGSKPRWHLTRSGGTNFDPPTDWVNGHAAEYDAVFFLTDLEAPKPKACRVPRFWLTDSKSYARPHFETNELIIQIPTE